MRTGKVVTRILLAAWGLLFLPALNPTSSWAAVSDEGQTETDRRGESEDQNESAEPGSRQELLRRKRLAKVEVSTPYVPNRVEREFLKMDEADRPTIQDINFHGFYPRIDWPSRGSGPAIGVRYWQEAVAGPLDLAGSAYYSWRDYQHYDIQFGQIPHIGGRLPDRSWKGDDLYELGSSPPGLGRLPFYFTFRYRYLPDEDYFGMGPESQLGDWSTYLHKETRFYLRTGYQFGTHVAWTVEGGYTKNELGAGQSTRLPPTQEVFDEETAPGLTKPPDYARFGTAVLIDFRDEPGNPHRGFMIALEATRFDDRTVGEYSFNRWAFDARAAVPLGARQRTLALRALVFRDEADPGNRVPFFMQESLGGSHTLRGFDSFRFRGERVMLYQAEYRWEPSSFWELALFTDAGTVGDAANGLRFSNLEWDYGAGMRFKTWRSVVLRLEIAWSRETTRYYFRTSGSF